MKSQPNESTNTNPFPGLRPFQPSEQHLFFGREDQVDSMVDKLAATRFLTVVGASGSGKSSLVNCGLIPALHYGLMSGAGTTWRIAHFRPGANPVYSAACALARNGVLFSDYSDQGMPLTDIVDATLRMSNLGLIDIVDQATLESDVNLLLVVDQFEELFRYRHIHADSQHAGQSAAEQAIAFVGLLLAAARQQELPIYIVLTMRSDFFGECSQFDGLPEAINAGQYLVPRLTRNQRREAIRGPVAVAGGKIAPVLLTRLINDVGDNPDQLSILQHALNRTWAHWEHNADRATPIDLDHYSAIGSMARALDRHAERAYAELTSPRQQQICEYVFRALTDRATDPRGVRRPTQLQSLCSIADASAEEITQVLDAFRKPSRSFLVPPADVALKPDTIVDISHESLMRVWHRLSDWANDEAEAVRTYTRLAETAALHRDGKAALWGQPDLGVALKWRDGIRPNKLWAEQYQSGYDDAIRFLEHSESAEKSRKRNRELVAAGLFTVFLGIVIGYGLKLNKEKEDLSEDLSVANAELVEIADNLIEREAADNDTIMKAEKAVNDAAALSREHSAVVPDIVEIEELLPNIVKGEIAHRDFSTWTFAALENELGDPALRRPVTCKSVIQLVPQECGINVFKPGRIYVFARVVIPEHTEDGNLTIKWSHDLKNSDFKVELSPGKIALTRNPDGYRTSSFRTLWNEGFYTACFFDSDGLPLAIEGSPREPACAAFQVQSG